MSAHGKRYRAALEQIDREHAYTPLEAVRILKGVEGARFDETVEAHFRLGLNVRHADQQLRGTIMLPHGIGKDVRVAVFAEGRRPGRRRRRVLTSSAPPTSRRGSRRDSSTSTSPSRRRTR